MTKSTNASWPMGYPPAYTQLSEIIEWATEVARYDVVMKACECMLHRANGVEYPSPWHGEGEGCKDYKPRTPELHLCLVDWAWRHAANARGHVGSIEWVYCIEDLDHGT